MCTLMALLPCKLPWPTESGGISGGGGGKVSFFREAHHAMVFKSNLPIFFDFCYTRLKYPHHPHQYHPPVCVIGPQPRNTSVGTLACGPLVGSVSVCFFDAEQRRAAD